MEKKIFTEENGFYQIDCQKALWATDEVGKTYHSAGLFLSDADFILEASDYIYIVEYKNACVPGANAPERFQPESDKKVNKIARKFYDTLPYLALTNKRKPYKYIYIIEYPNAGITERRFLRNKIAEKLPFKLQKGYPEKLIVGFEVLSINEWNHHQEYSAFPITSVIRRDENEKNEKVGK